MGLHLLNVYMSFDFRLEPSGLGDLYHKAGKEHTYFLRTFIVLIFFSLHYKKVVAFRVMFVNWKEKPKNKVSPQNCFMVIAHIFHSHCLHLMVSSSRVATACSLPVFVSSIPDALYLLSNIYWMSFKSRDKSYSSNPFQRWAYRKMKLVSVSFSR